LQRPLTFNWEHELEIATAHQQCVIVV